MIMSRKIFPSPRRRENRSAICIAAEPRETRRKPDNVPPFRALYRARIADCTRALRAFSPSAPSLADRANYAGAVITRSNTGFPYAQRACLSLPSRRRVTPRVTLSRLTEEPRRRRVRSSDLSGNFVGPISTLSEGGESGEGLKDWRKQ